VLAADSGQPFLGGRVESPAARAFRALADAVVDQLAG
jgi:hypothetical protein